MDINESKSVHIGQFRSGIAARLAGIPVETLRVWERRYGITGTTKTSGTRRLYDQRDIDRLSLLKRLVDLGQSIGTIARLDMPALEKIQASLMTLSGSERGGSVGHIRQIALVGPVLGSAMFRQALESESLSVTAQAASLSQLGSQTSIAGLDVIFIEVPTLLDHSAEEIRLAADSLQVRKIVLLYRFAPNAVIRKLRLRGFSVLRMPFDAQELVVLLGALMSREPSAGSRSVDLSVEQANSAPKFSMDQLAQLTQAKTGVYCECPSQLADLLMSITAFERYSAQCASQSPEDAALHKRLAADAVRVRKVLEVSITEVIRHENILI